MPRRKAQVSASSRPYTTDYGLTQGHCASPKGAAIAAARYLILNGVKNCTIEGPGGKAAARCYHSGLWGFVMVPAGKATAEVLHLIPKGKKGGKP